MRRSRSKSQISVTHEVVLIDMCIGYILCMSLLDPYGFRLTLTWRTVLVRSSSPLSLCTATSG